MKTFVIILLLTMTGLLSAGQQANGKPTSRVLTDAKSLIMDFLQEVYGTQNDALKVAYAYIGLENSSSQLSNPERYQVAAANILLMRKGEGISCFSTPLSKDELAAIQIVSYNSLLSGPDSKLLNFGLDSSQRKNLYVALKSHAAWRYFYVKEGRIYSFDYLLKGTDGPLFLFSY